MRLILVLAATVAGCASQDYGSVRFLSTQEEASTICEVMTDWRSYVGMRIIIRGVYFQEPHQRLLVDDDCPQWQLRVSHSEQIRSESRAVAIIKMFSKKDSTVRVPVIYSAVFTARPIIADCANPSCYIYTLENSQLLAAYPQSRTARGK
jgi:hypothetical protein